MISLSPLSPHHLSLSTSFYLSQEGRTPLHNACQNGHEDIVKRLLADDRVDKDAKDKVGRFNLLYFLSLFVC